MKEKKKRKKKKEKEKKKRNNLCGKSKETSKVSVCLFILNVWFPSNIMSLSISRLKLERSFFERITNLEEDDKGSSKKAF